LTWADKDRRKKKLLKDTGNLFQKKMDYYPFLQGDAVYVFNRLGLDADTLLEIKDRKLKKDLASRDHKIENLVSKNANLAL
jgi:hypothetical protein